MVVTRLCNKHLYIHKIKLTAQLSSTNVDENQFKYVLFIRSIFELSRVLSHFQLNDIFLICTLGIDGQPKTQEKSQEM
jgi:hypothetical protein